LETRYEEEIAMVEYSASFWNPDGVRKIKEQRKQSKLSEEISDDQFISQLKESSEKNSDIINAIKNIRNKFSENSNDENSLPYGSINLNKIIKDNI
jgi:hypothetical protein